ncbi:MAG: ATP-dependent helicase [Bacteroidetes bacterium]|nr:ATP-dependent helicase [Bacteroidota bacterium]
MIKLIDFENLNANQRCAVKWDTGPLLVLACPGSGKTGVLTLRVARILEVNEHAAVLALTFTNKAATEMRERVDQFLKKNTNRVRLCTFHRFASELLGQHGSHIGIRPDFSLLTQKEDRIAILEGVIGNSPNGQHTLPEDPNHLLHLIDRLFSEAYSGNGNFSPLPSTPPWLQPLFTQYCDALIRANRLDFGSLIYFANRLLREKPMVARVVRLSWTYLCIDEFQDTNKAQYDLIRLIAPDRHHNIFVVADDDQIIYQWNGASIQRLSDLRRDYELKIIQFPESYRCPPEIVNHANRLIEYNSRRMERETLVPRRQRGPSTTDPIRIKRCRSAAEEAAFVGEDILSRGLNASDCVVLGRTRRLLYLAVEELCNAGHKAVMFQKKNDFDSPILGVIVEVLKLTNLRHDKIVLRRLCQQWRHLTGVVIDPHAVDAEATLVGGDFLRAWIHVAGDQNDDGLLHLIRTNLVDRLDFRKIIDWVFEDGCKLLKTQDQIDLIAEEAEMWRSIDREIVREHGDSVTLNTYLQQLDLSSKVPPIEENTIRCMTVHQSKGLQFKHVYLIGMAQEIFPSYRALKKGPRSVEVEEERRICFVAITRVQNTLTLSWSEKYFGYSKEPSQFLRELGIEFPVPQGVESKLSLTANTPSAEIT